MALTGALKNIKEYDLIRWVINSSQMYLVPTTLASIMEETGMQLSVDPTKNNHFKIKSMSPQREYQFQELKKIYGSFYTFHGSSLSNWFSILYYGLKNYSGTSRQRNGAVYGPGIYMAEDYNTSNSYSICFGTNVHWDGSDLKINKCVAVCEVIALKEDVCSGRLHLKECCHSPNSPYIRCEDESLVATRYLITG